MKLCDDRRFVAGTGPVVAIVDQLPERPGMNWWITPFSCFNVFDPLWTDGGDQA
jgi:hypothetical protein